MTVLETFSCAVGFTFIWMDMLSNGGNFGWCSRRDNYYLDTFFDASVLKESF